MYHHNTAGSTTNAKYRVRAGDTVVVGGKSYTVGRNASHRSSGGYGGSGGGGGYSHSSSESHGNHSGGIQHTLRLTRHSTPCINIAQAIRLLKPEQQKKIMTGTNG